MKKNKMRLLALTLFIALIAPAKLMCQQEPVDLGSASNFVILAGSGISNVPTSAVTGNIGLSPAAGSFITGFGTEEVTGITYTVDATGPTGSVTDATGLESAKGYLTTAYNDAAGRMPVPEGDFLNPGAGDISGLTLIPGLYKFTGTAELLSGNVTFDAQGDADAVFIMMVASGLNTSSGTQAILIGGTKAANIFWQVGTSASLGTYSVFKGIIMADQSISMATGASIEGKLLASNGAVTLDACTVTDSGGDYLVPAVPVNVTTSIVGSDLVIDWDVSINATGYHVYSSDDPYGEFELVTSVGTNQYVVPATSSKVFYYIAAANGTK